jgi:hypothetical protein
MGNRDLEGRKLQEIPLSIRDDDDDAKSVYGSDISLLTAPAPSPGVATSFEIPILHSEHVHSSVSVPISEQTQDLPSEFGFVLYSDNSGSHNGGGSGGG